MLLNWLLICTIVLFTVIGSRAMTEEETLFGEVDKNWLYDAKNTVFWSIVVSIGVLIAAIFAKIVLVMLPAQVSEETGVEVTESVNERQTQRVTRRFRSLSASVDIDLSDHVGLDSGPVVLNVVAKTSWERQQQRVLSGASDRYRTMSTNYIERYRLLHHADCADLTVWKMKGMEMLRRVPEAFPFQSLPNDCRLTVFSFLNAVDRGVAAQVCSSWRDLIRSPTLWTTIDFNSFALCRRCAKLGRNCTPLCYAAYKSRVKSFFKFLISVRPTIHCLRAAFDIGDHRDGWLELLQELLRAAQCKDLVELDLNWKETPLKSIHVSAGLNATWSTGDAYDVIFQHRHRQRVFVKFFDFIVAAAPNITHLTIPFDWSERSVRAVGRLRRLDTLSLGQYFWMQGVDPLAIEQLVSSVSGLRTLSLEIWSASGYGLQLHTISSSSIEHLDLSRSRGVCLGSINLPRLQSLFVSRQPFSGPLVIEFAEVQLPCLRHVLVQGAPALKTINGHTLKDNWKSNVGKDEQLETILATVCSCSIHKPAA